MAQKLGSGRARAASSRVVIDSKADINVTPLVDVMLVLLIIFMAAVPAATTSLKLDLPPSMPGVPEPPPKPIYISLQDDGAIYLVDRKTSLDALPADVSAAMTARDGSPFARPVYIRAEAEVPYERFMAVMDRLRGAGFRQVSLISEDIA